MYRSKPWMRLSLFLVLIAFLTFPGTGYSNHVFAQPFSLQNDSPFTYRINFLPSTVKRLCVGDSAVFRFAIKLENEGLLAPLLPTQVSVVTSQGSVNPAVFNYRMFGSSSVFSFTYTADTPGDETITVQVVQGTGSATKSFKVLEACDYEVTFFASQQEDVEGGGYNVAFWGAGDLSMARRDEDGLALSGNGNDAGSLLIYAAMPELFSCSMVPFSANSTFKMDGALWPDQDLIHFNMEFDPMTFPDHMVFMCTAKGLGGLNFDLPIGKTSGDLSDLNLNGIVVDAAGGTYQFAFGKSTGVITVRKAAQ